jgi:hypothetical protein
MDLNKDVVYIFVLFVFVECVLFMSKSYLACNFHVCVYMHIYSNYLSVLFVLDNLVYNISYFNLSII